MHFVEVLGSKLKNKTARILKSLFWILFQNLGPCDNLNKNKVNDKANKCILLRF